MQQGAYETQRMALEHAILVSLAETPATGYDLMRRFDASVGFFWSAGHQQIYRTLARMERDGWVDASVEPGQGRPDRKVYAVTASGRSALRSWTQEPTPREALRSDFAVKLRALPHGDGDAVRADVRRQRDRHRERLEHYQDSCARHYPDPAALDDREIGPYLVLRGGIRSEQMYVDWCEEILAVLGAEMPSNDRESA